MIPVQHAPEPFVDHPSPNDLLIRCGAECYVVSKDELEKDFANFKTLFPAGREFDFGTSLQRGWKVIFNPSDWQSDDLELYKAVLECTLISASCSWEERFCEVTPPKEIDQLWSMLDIFRKTYPSGAKLIGRLHAKFMAITLEEYMHQLAIVNRTSQSIQKHGSSCAQLSLKSLPTVLAFNFRKNFPNASSLTVEQPLDSTALQALLKQGKKFEVLNIRVSNRQVIELSWFESSGSLQELHIQAVQAPDLAQYNAYCFRTFTNPSALSHLTSLSLTHAFLDERMMESLGALSSLRNLNLEHSQLLPRQNLQNLRCLKELRSLRLEGVILPSRHPNFLLGQIHLLSKQLPQAEITPKVTLVDLTDYRGVITSGSEEEFAYSLKAIEEADEIDVRGLLRQDVESTFWSIDFALLHSCRQHLPYDHNKITIAHNGKQLYFNGSPINCPDARLRIATPEPDRKSLMGDFWQVVRIFDVRVVAMVKEIEKETYFPLKKGDSCTYIGLNSETIRVTCLDLVQITEDISFRLLQVGDKEVSHLQINWEDGEGIDVNKLWLFLQKLTELEQKTPLGATIVHCLAGVGRTGTMLACMIVEQLMKNISKTESLQLNLKLLFRALRQQRPSMIQTEPQLLTVLAYFRKRAKIT